MAPVPFKSIASVSSEDERNPASNLLSPVPGGKWLCALENKSRTAEVVLELAKRARIIALEICNFGSAFVEVLVSDSSYPDQCVTLLPVSMLMTSVESRSGRNKNKVAIYCKDKFSATATRRKWNRVSIRCVQKYNRESQFGLRAVSFFAESHDPDSIVTGRAITSPMPHRPVMTTPPSSVLVSKPKQELSQSKHPRHSSSLSLTPKSSRSDGATPKQEGRLKWTPSRLNGAKNEDSVKDYEFSGVERQSRLFNSCMQQKPDDSDGMIKGSNQILDRISAEKEKYRDVLSPLCSQKKLLKRELPKAEVMKDFVKSYKDRKVTTELAGACRKMSSHDNDYEIGEEPEKTWGWNKFAGKPKRYSGGVRRKKGHHSNAGWFSKRKKLSGMIQHCSDILSKAGAVGDGTTLECNEEDELTTEEEDATGGDVKPECEKVAVAEEDTCLDITCSVREGSHASDATPSADSSMVECPLCSAFFPSYAIELHASQCGEGATTTPYSFITID